MTETLVPMQCARCGHRGFRYHALYTQMMAECGRAWCLSCAPRRYREASSQRELLDIAQALIAQTRANLADYGRQRRDHPQL
jgi:hypothetical protein